MNDMSAVVFQFGEHHYEGAYGSATVHVPRDVTLGDIEPALTNFVREAWGEKRRKRKMPREKESAPAVESGRASVRKDGEVYHKPTTWHATIPRHGSAGAVELESCFASHGPYAF